MGIAAPKGETPRNFAHLARRPVLLAANQDSDTVVTMPIDPETGVLGETVSVAQVPTPVCLKFGV